MRIIGEFDAGSMKVTVMKMNERLSLKLESGLMEQTYKFRDGSGIESFQDAQHFCDEDFISNVHSIFQAMAAARNTRFDSLASASDGEEIVII